MSENKEYTDEEILEYLKGRNIAKDIIDNLTLAILEHDKNILKPKFISMAQAFEEYRCE